MQSVGILSYRDIVSNPSKELKRQEKIIDNKIEQAIGEMKLRKREIMNVVKKDPRKFSASNIKLKVVIQKRPSRFEEKIKNDSTENCHLEELLMSKRFPVQQSGRSPIEPSISEVPALPLIPKGRRRRRVAKGVNLRDFNNAFIVSPRFINDPVTRQSNNILTPRRQLTEDLIFGRGKVLGGEKGRALPIQYQEFKYKLQNHLIQAIKEYDT